MFKKIIIQYFVYKNELNYINKWDYICVTYN